MLELVFGLNILMFIKGEKLVGRIIFVVGLLLKLIGVGIYGVCVIGFVDCWDFDF